MNRGTSSDLARLLGLDKMRIGQLCRERKVKNKDLQPLFIEGEHYEMRGNRRIFNIKKCTNAYFEPKKEKIRKEAIKLEMKEKEINEKKLEIELKLEKIED